ncbi:MAG: SRPBCC domain-containing protein [Pseudomonadota bacterium]
MTDLPTYILDRTFDAPRELVWRTWTDATLLPRWYGPNVQTIIHRLDVKAGGEWITEMKCGEHSSFQIMKYTEVKPLEKLVGLQSSTDADENIIPSPMMKDWPKVLLTRVTFEEMRDGKTQMRLTWVPHEATDAEIACFTAAIDGMGKGWNAGMELLGNLLHELQQ